MKSVMARGKKKVSDDIDFPQKKKTKCLEDGKGYKYLRVLKAEELKVKDMKEKTQKEY